jgi:hypothetical protein
VKYTSKVIHKAWEETEYFDLYSYIRYDESYQSITRTQFNHVIKWNPSFAMFYWSICLRHCVRERWMDLFEWYMDNGATDNYYEVFMYAAMCDADQIIICLLEKYGYQPDNIFFDSLDNIIYREDQQLITIICINDWWTILEKVLGINEMSTPFNLEQCLRLSCYFGSVCILSNILKRMDNLPIDFSIEEVCDSADRYKGRKLNEVMSILVDDDRIFLDNGNWSMFIVACKRQFIGVVRKLLNNSYVDPTMNNQEALYIAIEHNNAELLKVLLDTGRMDPYVNDGELIKKCKCIILKECYSVMIEYCVEREKSIYMCDTASTTQYSTHKYTVIPNQIQ